MCDKVHPVPEHPIRVGVLGFANTPALPGPPLLSLFDGDRVDFVAGCPAGEYVEVGVLLWQ